MSSTPEREIPYDQQEARVAQWLVDRTGIGGGNDPVGFILASYDLKIREMDELRSKLASLEELLAVSAKTCGNTCNCTGSESMKKALKAHMEKFA